MYQSIPSLTISPGDPWGFAHSSCPRGSVFAPLSCPGVLNQSISSNSSFHMFISRGLYMLEVRSVIYTVTNTKRIRIYPDKLKYILVKTFMGSRTKKTKFYSRLLPLRIYLDSPVHTSANTESIQICSVMGKFIYTVI